MRIALVTETFYPSTDGTTTTLKAVADRLVDSGHEVRIVAPGPGIGSYRGCRVVRIRPLEPVGAQVRAAIDEFRPDLVHVTSPGTLGRKALKHTHRQGVASVVVEQGPALDVAADYWRAKVADRADVVLVTSTWMIDRMAEFGVAAGLWRPGVDTDAYTPSLRDQWLYDAWSKARATGAKRESAAVRNPEDWQRLSARTASPRNKTDGPRVVVGYVGGLHKRHGVRRLAEVASIPTARLVVIGAGPQRDWLESKAVDAKLIGPLQTGDLTIALPTLDVLVHPGEHETCCHALREAAASGVPVVAPRSGGAPDVVRHLETGMLYDPRDPRDLRRAVTAVVADRHRSLLGKRARELAQLRTWTDAVDELVANHYPQVAATREEASL
jgi:phosphatidylinositol alpha 1,6-mannosyltransferase